MVLKTGGLSEAHPQIPSHILQTEDCILLIGNGSLPTYQPVTRNYPPLKEQPLYSNQLERRILVMLLPYLITNYIRVLLFLSFKKQKPYHGLASSTYCLYHISIL